MLRHCPLPHIDQVSCSTLLPQSGLLFDPDPQTFNQLLFNHYGSFLQTGCSFTLKIKLSLPPSLPLLPEQPAFDHCTTPFPQCLNSFNSIVVERQHVTFWFLLLVSQAMYIFLCILEEGLVSPLFWDLFCTRSCESLVFRLCPLFPLLTVACKISSLFFLVRNLFPKLSSFPALFFDLFHLSLSCWMFSFASLLTSLN